ncbi:MAG: methylenetetrahydrofolate reductase [NAD(P)H], partial [Aestuariivirga sp.]
MTTTDATGGLSVSFEFFPPKAGEAETTFWRTIAKLEPVHPSFVSVTYGAGGTTRDRTLATVARIARETSLKPAAHLTCVGASKDEVNAVIREFRDAGVNHIVALRGDPPGGVGTRFVPHPEGYRNAADLVRGIREIGDFEVSVSAYPERHPESVSIEEDLAFMADKADHGATRALSQFFFHNAFFLRLRDRIAARGIGIELVPGILPITSFARVQDFAAKCGAHIPPALARRFEGLDEDPETRNLVAAMVAAEQVSALQREGVNHFHFYTLNRADLVYA